MRFANRARVRAAGRHAGCFLVVAMRDYPVHVDVASPPRLERIQLLLRVALAVVLGWLGITAGWLVCTMYVLLPVIAAIAISSRGSTGYPTEVGPKLWRVLAWLLQLSAYMMLLVDRFPTGGDYPARPEIRFTGQPTIGSALLRLATSIPSGVVLVLLWCVSTVLWLMAAVLVVVGATVPEPILAYQRGVLRWQARLVAYHASLVDEYPPFSFGPEDGSDAAAAGTGAR
jgi:hypothetical protein